VNDVPPQAITGVIHTEALEQLGFTGPSELQYVPVQNAVIALLNTPVASTNFYLLY
jgi:hypothetical protein